MCLILPLNVPLIFQAIVIYIKKTNISVCVCVCIHILLDVLYLSLYILVAMNCNELIPNNKIDAFYFALFTLNQKLEYVLCA